MSKFEKGLEIKNLCQLKVGSRYFITKKGWEDLCVLDDIREVCCLEPSGVVVRNMVMFLGEDGSWYGITSKNIESYKIFEIKKPFLV